MDLEDDARLLAASAFFALGAVALLRLVITYGVCPIRERRRGFHLLLGVFAVVRGVDTLMTAIDPAARRDSELAIVLSRISICLFFSLFSQIVAQWCVHSLGNSPGPLLMMSQRWLAGRRFCSSRDTHASSGARFGEQMRSSTPSCLLSPL